MKHALRQTTVGLLVLLSAGLFAGSALLEKNAALDMKDLSGQSLSDLIVMRNSIFARYGYVFKSAALRNYFSGFSWYRPDPKFSFNALSKADQQNVNALQAAERQKVAELKRGLEDARYGSPRYFLSMREGDRVPDKTRKEMIDFWKMSLSPSLARDIRVPEFLSAVMTGEKNRNYIDGRAGQPDKRFTWWEANYDGKGVLRRLKGCASETGNAAGCNDTCYFDENGKLLLVTGNMVGTVNYEYYYQYCLGSVVWIEVTIIDGAAGSTDKTVKFFY
jgi:hypothetical protein